MADLITDVVRHGVVEANDLRFHYAAAGEERGMPVLLAHGFPESWHCWAKILPHLADAGCYAIAPDQRGYNLSDKPDGVDHYRPKHLVEDLDQIAATMFGDDVPFTLIAHDWGGAIAWAFAIQRPERLKRLIVVNATHPGAFQREMARNPEQAERSQYINLFRSDEAEAVHSADGFGKLHEGFEALYQSGAMTDNDRAHYDAAWGEPGALTGMFNWYRAMRIEPPKSVDEQAMKDNDKAIAFDDSALAVKIPVRVLWGMQDHAFSPALLDHFPEFCADLEIVEIPDGTHWVIHEKPDFIAENFVRWLRSE